MSAVLNWLRGVLVGRDSCQWIMVIGGMINEEGLTFEHSTVKLLRDISTTTTWSTSSYHHNFTSCYGLANTTTNAIRSKRTEEKEAHQKEQLECAGASVHCDFKLI
jgi:hypothetical protein